MLRHLGTVIHAAAQLIAEGESESAVAARIDDIWPHLDFGSVWYGSRQRELAERMVRKFLDWHAANPRELLATEQSLRVRVGRVEITGRVDRLERDGQGRGVIVDLKTGGTAPREEELDRHPQLGVYQLAVLLGAFERLGVTDPGGAELVQVGKAGLTARAKVQHQRALAEDPDPDWAGELVAAVATGMAGPGPTRPGPTRAAGPARWRPAARCRRTAPRLASNPNHDESSTAEYISGRRYPSVDHVTSRGPARDDRSAWAEPGVEVLGRGLYRIPLPLPNDGLTAVNVYAMTGEHGVDLIDAGMALVQARERLTKALGQLGYGLPDIRNLFITRHSPGPLHPGGGAAEHAARADRAGEGERDNLVAIRDVAEGNHEPGFIEMLPALGAADLAAQVRAIVAPGLANPQPPLKWDDPDRWLKPTAR